ASINTPYSVVQERAKPIKPERLHLYSASPNEIDEKKPELKDFPNHLEYAYLHGDKSFPIIISFELSDKEKSSLLQVLEKRKGAIAWKMLDIKGISPSYCIHNILMEDDFKPVIQPQRHLNLKVQDVVKNEIVKLLDSGFFQIPIAPEDQEKTTFTCPYGTFAYRRMTFGLCNAPATFQRCMTAIFHDMVEDFMEVFMDNFSVTIRILDDSTVTYTKAPPSLDYVPGPEHPTSPVYVPYVPELVYPEFMPPEDDVLPAEEKPLHAAISPTADSPDDDDEEEEESSGDDADDDEEDEDDDEEEWEEHLASADSVPLPVHRVTARISVRAQTPISLPLDTEILSPPLPVLPPPLPASPTYPLGYKAAMIWLRAKSPSTSHQLPLPSPIVLPRTRAYVAMMRAAAPSTYILAPRSGILPSGTPPLLPIPLRTPSPPLLLPSTDCRAGVSEVTLPPRKRLCIALGPRYKVGESSSAPTTRPTRGFRADYGFVGTLDDEIRQDPEREVCYRITDTWDEMVEDMQGTPTATDVAELNQRMTDFVTTVRQDTDEIYGRLDDAHDDRSLMSGQLNMLCRDRCAHAHTAKLIETEAILSRKAWVQSMDSSDTTRSETQVTALQSQQGPASGPTHPEIPEEASTPKRTTRSTPAVTTTTTTTVTDAQLKALIDQGVANALAASDADKSRNGEDSHDSGTGVRRQAPLAGECTYPDFMKCKPLYFKGTEVVIELTQWFERMETVFRISNCSMENQIKFSTCTLLGSALTWWKSHVKTVGHDVAYAMT
ncbi:reverse transcriptase domain-containing protein, partial [Tanacetum coccineum]